MSEKLKQLQELKDDIAKYCDNIATDKEIVLSSVALKLKITKKSLINRICYFIIKEIQEDIKKEIDN